MAERNFSTLYTWYG